MWPISTEAIEWQQREAPPARRPAAPRAGQRARTTPPGQCQRQQRLAADDLRPLGLPVVGLPLGTSGDIAGVGLGGQLLLCTARGTGTFTRMTVAGVLSAARAHVTVAIADLVGLLRD